MYQPDHYRVEDVAQMHVLTRAKPLAALVSCGSSGLYASHLPTVLKDDGAFGVIEYHLARANPHWKDLAEGNEALMIFQGPEGYNAQLVPFEGSTREGRADMELCGGPRLWSPRSDEG
jgi:transcriptional regulator